MTKITVYNFRVPDIREGQLVLAKGKCTRELVASFHGEVIESTAEEIDDSLLNATGRYHPPESDGETA